ncbi:MAG: NAD(P)/FAD-dependent oxidoreductase [Armatimonadetes bacterium]|nr:NAD(P)/FAD-dependent oxidoreductase [Armatimonadota bacterium]MDW8122837.1 FAD/NAD(P)-binding oxidoreductase [Armatimonadota bacterium]
MSVKIVIVGAGPGGITVANRLAFLAPEDWQIIVVSASRHFTFQTGWLKVALGQENPQRLKKPLTNLLQPRVTLRLCLCRGIDVTKRMVVLDGGRLEYDFLVLATGCVPNPSMVDGLQEGALHFHDEAAALRLREVLSQFEGGRIVVGVGGFPYKCPPSPIEFTCLLHEYLVKRGIRSRTELVYATPLPRVFHMEPLVPIFEERFDEEGIVAATFFTLERMEPDQKKAISMDGQELTADLFVLVPPHQGAEMVRTNGLGDPKGYLNVDRTTLKVVGLERVYALGDGTNLPTPKALTAAQKQGQVVADNLLAESQGRELRSYNGQVGCLIEVGNGLATLAIFDYDNPPRPPKPTTDLFRAKRKLQNFVLQSLRLPV